MSCHSIGHGLNSVSKKVLELYDEGKIEFSVAKDLLYTTRNAVHYCDGNTYEAIACFDGCRCARCLKKTNELYGLYDALDECREYYDIFLLKSCRKWGAHPSMGAPLYASHAFVKLNHFLSIKAPNRCPSIF